MNYLRNLAWVLIVVICATQCSSPKSSSEGEAAEDYGYEEASADVQSAVCLGNNVSVRESPSSKGKKITSIAIGERVVYLDSVVADTGGKTKYDYCLVRLSDGTEGWAVKAYLFENRELGAILKNAQVYRRPDLLTAKESSFSPMDLVSIKRQEREPNHDWLYVTGRTLGSNAFIDGWVRSENVTEVREDILVAQQVYQANELKDEKRMAQLNSIVENADNKYSAFIKDVRALMFSDPSRLLQEDFEKYYIGMIDYYDSAGHDYLYLFEESGPSVTLSGTTFFPFKITDIDYYEYYHVWSLFYQFATFVASEKGFTPRGYYNTDYDYNDMLTAMEQLSGYAVYIDRHEEDYSLFPYVNPNFVKWVGETLIPHPDNEFLGVSSREIYEVVFRNNARTMWRNWRQLEQEYDIEELASRYRQGMESEGFHGFEYLKNEFLPTGIDPVMAGVFIRRYIDGSYDEVTFLMMKIMALYDGDWVKEQMDI